MSLVCVLFLFWIYDIFVSRSIVFFGILIVLVVIG